MLVKMAIPWNCAICKRNTTGEFGERIEKFDLFPLYVNQKKFIKKKLEELE